MRNKKLFWGSSYDRGLDILLNMWPKIKKAHPDATLDICYGWNLFVKGYQNNPERMAWKDKIDKLMEQEGITHHGRVDQKKLQKIMLKCGIWAYPTYFQETNCITALQCQRDGVVPVTIELAGLKLTVGSGIKIKGDIYLRETKEQYLKELIDLMGDEKRWLKESKRGIAFSKLFSWERIADKWEEYFV